MEVAYLPEAFGAGRVGGRIHYRRTGELFIAVRFSIKNLLFMMKQAVTLSMEKNCS